jgi:formyltetrahydrofolate deformylase
MAMDNPQPSILLVECPDRAGLVHGITGVLFRHGLNVVGNQEFVDRASARFFMRTEFDGAADRGALVREVRTALPPEAVVRLANPDPKRIVVFASKEHHCLADILVRHAYAELNVRIAAVVSNHASLEPLVRKFDLPFHHVPAEGLDRGEHEERLQAVLEPLAPEYLVLAKYMRVLTPLFVRRWPDRIINIHHSFLPAFAGARPYHQAFVRGVKVIGATAHFVTDELDAGPILLQQVVPVDHTHAPEDLVQAGRDVEQIVLARALRLVIEDRVFLCGGRTVIFD